MEKGVKGKEEVSITFEDQQNINSFSRLNNRFHDVEDEIKAKKEEAANLEDASNELVLMDEDHVKYAMGEVFVHSTSEKVEELLEALKEQTTQELDALEEERGKIVAQMVELKKVLYAKFGSDINLEED